MYMHKENVYITLCNYSRVGKKGGFCVLVFLVSLCWICYPFFRVLTKIHQLINGLLKERNEEKNCPFCIWRKIYVRSSNFFILGKMNVENCAGEPFFKLT